MYNFPYFKEKNEKVVLEFIKDHPFAVITGSNKQGEPFATQIPVFIEEENGKRFLRGHMMKNNDHHKAFSENPKVLVVFNSQHCYVSATWYSNKNEASTWNYISVHAKGNIRFLDDEALINVLRMTSSYFENQDKNSPTIYDNLPSDYTDKLRKAIVAFEVEILEMDNVFKLSQNRDKFSYENIINKLNEQGGEAAYIAKEMEKRKEALFNLSAGRQG